MRDLHVRLLSLVLIAVGLALTAYKSGRLGLPLAPGEETPVWTVEARASFSAGGGAVKAELTIPDDPPGFVVIDEDFISSSFGLAVDEDGLNRKAQWAVRRASGRQVLYYRISLYRDREANAERGGPRPEYPEAPDYPEPQAGAIKAILEKVRSQSADIATFTRELIHRLAKDSVDENAKLLRKLAPEPDAWVHQLGEVLAGARIPSRVVWGLRLSDGMSHAQLEPVLEVHNGERWITFDPYTGDMGFPDDFLVWQIADGEVLEVTKGSKVQLEFSAASHLSDLVTVAKKRAQTLGSRMMEFSLFSLPLDVQNVYRVLLTIPLGVALLVILRNVVGIKSFGTFMPVLIALAFRETNLVWGVTLFLVVVSAGLLIRFYLENLKLLLVPRLGAVVTIVILLMLVVSVLSHRLGLEQGLSVSLFPMVVMAMTIERMSVMWEESGPREALLQGLGSIGSACGAYLVMQNETLQYLVFVFPELLLVLLATLILLGRYKGYRLTELWRFRALLEEKS